MLTIYVFPHIDKTISFSPCFGSAKKDAFLKVVHIAAGQHSQQVRVHQLIERMESCGGSQSGCFHIDLSLKKVARLVLGWNMDAAESAELSTPFEEAREGEMERQLLESLRQQVKTLKFVFEVDGQLRVDRAEGVVDALESLGPIGATALGGSGFGLEKSDSFSNQ